MTQRFAQLDSFLPTPLSCSEKGWPCPHPLDPLITSPPTSPLSLCPFEVILPPLSVSFPADSHLLHPLVAAPPSSLLSQRCQPPRPSPPVPPSLFFLPCVAGVMSRVLLFSWWCGLVLLVSLLPRCAECQFSLLPTSALTPFNGRFGASLVSLPYSLSYQAWSYVVNATAPCTSASPACVNAPYQQVSAVTPVNSLFLFGGQCGHGANALTVLGDPDVWTSPDGGVTWALFGGAHQLSGSAQVYVGALSANTPYWQGSNPASYSTALPQPTTYAIYPGSAAVHDSVHQRFHVLGGDAYYGGGVWRPTAEVQNSGSAGTALNSTTSGAPLNVEGLGWTNLCLDPVGGLSYSTCDSFTVRTSAASTVDSRGNVYLLNGVASYDSAQFPYVLQGDVWMSTNGALTWTQQAVTTPWSVLQGVAGRMESAAVSFYSTTYSADVLYNIGGCGTTTTGGFNTAGSSLQEVGYADVYASITQGVSWYTVTTSAAFSARCGLSAVVSSGGVLVIVGGRTPQTYSSSGAGWPTYYTATLGLTTLTDLWTSLDGGAQWYQLSTTGGRDRAAIALDSSGFLHVVGGRLGVGVGYSTAACPTDAYISSQSLNNISAWLSSVVSGATIPAATGLRSSAVTQSVTPASPFNMTTLNAGGGFNGRAGAGLVVLPNPITFRTWSYTINSTYPTASLSSTTPPGLTNATLSAPQFTQTTDSASLFLFGGECGHGVSPSASVGDPDVWASKDNGATWLLVGGAHGLDFDSNTGTYGQYVSALSGNTPFWQGSSPATYLAVSAPQSYATYPGATPLHDSVNHKFYLLGGEAYAGSGRWGPTSISQSSGAPSASLLQLSSVSGTPINPEAIGWTNACLNASGSYGSCSAGGTFPARSSAAGCVDSRGALYLFNGISTYDYTNVFPQQLFADVWTSTNLGLSWTQPTLSVPWGGVQGRMESGAVSYYSSTYNADVLYSIGGCTVSSSSYGTTGATLVETGFQDVYASINGGVTWYNISLSAAWPARCGVTVAVTSGGVLALVGGRRPQSYLTTAYPTYYEAVLGFYTLSDLWASLDGGVTWLQLSSTGGRDRPAVVFDSSGYLHVVSGRVTTGVYYFNTQACPSDSLVSSLSFAQIAAWIRSIPGLATANVPAAGLGLRTVIPGASSGPACTSSFCMVGTNTNASFNGRFGAGLVTLNYPITYQTWSYVINSSYPTISPLSTNPPGLFNSAGTQQYNYATSATAPAGSLYLYGGQCGHQANPATPLGDPDVWTSPDGGYTWKQLSGASGLSGSYQIYANALSANSPAWGGGQASNPATYPTVSVPQTYGIYPGQVPIHDGVNHRFHLLGGDYYYGSGIWRPTATQQSSGGAYSLNSTGGAALNLEGLGWTNLCLDPVGGLTYSYCDSFTDRTSAAGTSDSKGTLYIINGISQYDSNVFPYVLLGDVWTSSNGGLVWSQAAAVTPWSTKNGLVGRMESAAASYYSTFYSADVIYSIGGCSTSSTGFNVAGSTLIEQPYNDVYASITQGKVWYTVTAAAAFPARCGLSVAVTTGGVLVVVGGRSAQSYTSLQAGWPTYYNSILGASTLSDIWASMDGGVTFLQLTTTGGRDRAAIAFDNSGFLHIVGGKTGLGQGYLPAACPNDAYVSTQSFNNITAWIKLVVPSATPPTTTGLAISGLSSSVPLRIPSSSLH